MNFTPLIDASNNAEQIDSADRPLPSISVLVGNRG